MILDPLLQRSEFVNAAGMLQGVVSNFSKPRTKTLADICRNRERFPVPDFGVKECVHTSARRLSIEPSRDIICRG